MEEDRPSSRGKAGTRKVVGEKDKRMKTKCRLERSIRYYQKGNGKTQWSEEEFEASKEEKKPDVGAIRGGGPAVEFKYCRVSTNEGLFPLENLVNVCL